MRRGQSQRGRCLMAGASRAERSQPQLIFFNKSSAFFFVSSLWDFSTTASSAFFRSSLETPLGFLPASLIIAAQASSATAESEAKLASSSNVLADGVESI